jgi:hypothetical protein
MNRRVARFLVVALAPIAIGSTAFTVALASGWIPGRCESASCWFPYLSVWFHALGILIVTLPLGIVVGAIDAFSLVGRLLERLDRRAANAGDPAS